MYFFAKTLIYSMKIFHGWDNEFIKLNIKLKNSYLILQESTVIWR